MAYPTVSAPYGLKPVNLIGGQVFAGSTRQLAIQYNYGINIFFGDVVSITRGYIARLPVTSGPTSGNDPVGVFLGCSFTNPVTKQKTFSQFWPANTLAGDAIAYVTDDPDTLFKVAAVTANGVTTVGSVARSMIGQNIQGSELAGNINTGDSYIAMLSATTTVATTATFPYRIVDVVPETAVTTTATLSSGGGTTTLTTSVLPTALPYGAEVLYLAANGQLIATGSWVAAAVTAGATSVTLNAQAGTLNAGGSASTGITIPNGSTLVFIQYPEAIVKINFGVHGYYNATGATTA